MNQAWFEYANLITYHWDCMADSWDEHRLYVSNTLRELKDGQAELKSMLQKHIVEETENKIKLKIFWAALALIASPVLTFALSRVLNLK